MPPHGVVRSLTAHHNPPDVRMCTWRNQSRVGTRPPSSPKHPLHQCGNKPTLFRTASPALARLLCLASGRGAHAPDDGPAGAGPAQASLTFSAARSVVSLTFSAVRAAASLLLSTPRFTAPAVSLMPFLILSV